jgi:2-C-methyl-D-erythritol 4-phosphate cytidylyltransferase/2-C-methyl-D-erythritol 2,4-cyclodiphosphate synthase
VKNHPQLRTGIGTDVHAFDANSVLWLGLLEWPGERGLAGHSDADVVSHAICDSLFSATATGDMGSNFGTDRPEFKNASGETFLKAALKIIDAAGFAPVNVAVTVIGNQPKVSSRRDEMQKALSGILNAPVSVSATTTDGLGLTGRGEGIAAIATCLVEMKGE